MSASTAEGVRWYERGYGLDRRSLGLARVGIGAVVLLDTMGRLRYAAPWAGDAGVFPRDMVHTVSPHAWPPSLHMLSGETWWQVALLSITALAALALTLGYRTWIATIACWFLVASVQARTPHVAYGFDDELRGLLFWAMFVPLGSRFGVDAGADERAGRSDSFSGVGSTGLALYVALMYLVTGLLKVGASWQSELTAIYYALSIDQLRGVLGPALLDHPGLMAVLTFLVPKIEVTGAVLMLGPARHVWIRVTALAMLAALSIGLAASMRLGLFPWLNLVALLPFVPGAVWDRLARREPAPARPEPLASDHLSPPGRRRWGAPPPGWQVVAVLPLLLIVVWNVSIVFALPPGIDRPTRTVAHAVRLDPLWVMFAPNPPRRNLWLVAAGRTGAGTEIDVLRSGQPVDPETIVAPGGQVRPPRPRFGRPATFRWLRFRERLMAEYRTTGVPVRYASYLCREWNGAHAEGRVSAVRLVAAGEDILPANERRSRPPEELAAVSCTPDAPASRRYP